MRLPVNVIVRYHEGAESVLLGQAIDSLAQQTHAPIRAIVTVQHFSEGFPASVDKLLRNRPLGSVSEIQVIPVNVPKGKDGRCQLLNRGLQEVREGYLAFLDYDDRMYSDAYSQLTSQLEASQAAAAVGGCEMVQLSWDGSRWKESERKPFPRGGKRRRSDLLCENFIPFHSFLIQLDRVRIRDLRFDEELSRLEDYDFLLRFACEHEFDFTLIDRPICDYRVRKESSNVFVATSPGADSSQEVARWESATQRLAQKKKDLRMTFTVAELAEMKQKLERCEKVLASSPHRWVERLHKILKLV